MGNTVMETLLDIDTPLVMDADDVKLSIPDDIAASLDEEEKLMKTSEEFQKYSSRSRDELVAAYVDVSARIAFKEKSLFNIERTTRKVGAHFAPDMRASAKRCLINVHNSKPEISALYREWLVILLLLDDMTDSTFDEGSLNDRIKEKVAELETQVGR
jgi:hypothetical protein